MKIWIDLTNSPHVNFFAGMIQELRVEHELLITCRSLGNTIELLDLFGFPYVVVGRHYGQGSVGKVGGFWIRILQLYRYLRNKASDVAISHSSFYSPLVASMLGIPSFYLNDNEHAEGNRVSFLFADTIMVPEFIDIAAIRKQWARKQKIIKYPGVKEGIYLWSYPMQAANRKQQYGCRQTIFIRPEPWTAQYYHGKRNFMDELLLNLKDRFDVVLLPRGDIQRKYYKQNRFGGIRIPHSSIPMNEIMNNCDLFIGAGGTMTREAAVLGIPTISIYQDRLLAVDRFLIEKGLMVHQMEPNASFVEGFLLENERIPPNRKLLDDGHKAYELIKRKLLHSISKRG